MRIWVAKTLVEDIDLNSCSVNLFNNEKDAIEWADKEIDDYGVDYENGIVTDREPHFYRMACGDCYVTIEIEEHELDKKS